MSNIYYHKHHIIPKHAGGTDDPSNIIKLTIEDHAEAHKILWEQHGRWQDKLAWETLSGRVTREEATRIAVSKTMSILHKGKPKTEQQKQKIREANLREKNPNYGKNTPENVKEKIRQATLKEKNHFFGKHHTETTKIKISKANKGKHPWNKGLKFPFKPRKTHHFL